MLGSGWGELGGGKSVEAREHGRQRAVREAFCILLFVLCVLLICIVAVTVPFAVLFNCPYPDPQIFAFFCPFSSPLQ